jgi:hypothetical protein
MKKYQELHIRVEPGNLCGFLEALQSASPNDWQRDDESESRSLNTTGRLFAYYRCTENPKRRSAMVAMYRKGRNMIYVSNVVPLGNIEPLTHDEYNAILMDFHDRILRNLATEFPVTVIVSGERTKD